MDAGQLLEVPGHDAVWRVDCGETVAFVALHALIAGRTFGGIRIRAYPDEDAALADVLDLSRAMSRKLALAQLDGGGAKAVLLAPPPGADRSACVARLGAFIESLEGRYCCGPDLGFTDEDDVALRSATRHVAVPGMSAATARTVLDTLLVACPQPRRVAIQGLGNVGLPLARYLADQGVEVVAAEPRGSDEFPLVPSETIHRERADVFAPCAAGGVLDAAAVDELGAAVVCGGANNPLADEAQADRLHERGVVLVPDVLSNSGAAIVGVSTTLGEERLIDERLAAVGPFTAGLLARAREQDRSPHHVARDEADALIAARRPSSSGSHEAFM